MGFHTGFFQQLEEMNGSFQVCLTDALNGQADRIFARIEHAVFSGAVIFEFQEHVAVIQ